jgi:hypothetical protein
LTFFVERVTLFFMSLSPMVNRRESRVVTSIRAVAYRLSFRCPTTASRRLRAFCLSARCRAGTRSAPAWERR